MLGYHSIALNIMDQIEASRTFACVAEAVSFYYKRGYETDSVSYDPNLCAKRYMRNNTGETVCIEHVGFLHVIAYPV